MTISVFRYGSGITRRSGGEELLDGLPEQLRVVSGEFDVHDVHLVAAAAARGADVICSSDRRHLPEGRLAGDLKVIGPGRLAAALGVG